MDCQGKVCLRFWATCSDGVVSLLDMLEFAAADFVESSHQFGVINGVVNSRSYIQKPEGMAGNAFGDLLVRAGNLGLSVTTGQLVGLIQEHSANAPEAIRAQNRKNLEQGNLVIGGQMDLARLAHDAEAIYSTLRSELASLLFCMIPQERTLYWKGWLNGSAICDKFPTSGIELERGGRCYALGEPTACVFHAMRALEPGLAAIGKPFNVSMARDNWQNVIEQIESAIRELGRLPRGEQKVEDEKFFGSAAANLYFVKNAWRNHVAHTRDSYSDSEARKILDRSRDFIDSLCPRLQE